MLSSETFPNGLLQRTTFHRDFSLSLLYLSLSISFLSALLSRLSLSSTLAPSSSSLSLSIPLSLLSPLLSLSLLSLSLSLLSPLSPLFLSFSLSLSQGMNYEYFLTLNLQSDKKSLVPVSSHVRALQKHLIYPTVNCGKITCKLKQCFFLPFFDKYTD